MQPPEIGHKLNTGIQADECSRHPVQDTVTKALGEGEDTGPNANMEHLADDEHFAQAL